ncbi:hypothetical protein QJS66_22175 [Kocuria rhizophila]|nr:hypothetical protein QJS66_22175 [Kocuria rhizophila]
MVGSFGLGEWRAGWGSSGPEWYLRPGTAVRRLHHVLHGHGGRRAPRPRAPRRSRRRRGARHAAPGACWRSRRA